jgi:hypothetical protein
LLTLAGRRVGVQNALLNRLVDYRDGFGVQRPRVMKAARGQRGAQLLDLCAQTAAVGGVGGVAARVLAIALLR